MNHRHSCVPKTADRARSRTADRSYNVQVFPLHRRLVSKAFTGLLDVVAGSRAAARESTNLRVRESKREFLSRPPHVSTWRQGDRPR